MSRAGYDGADRENAFGLTFPEKRTVEFRLTDKRACLITNIDEVGGDHRNRKRDRDRVALGNLSARRIDHNAAGIGFRVRCFLFLFFVGIRSRQSSRRAKRKTAGDEKQDCY
jgi:hypothetical protein